jgi:AraC-like DNA-binding protein
MKDFKVKYNNGGVHECRPEWSWTFRSMADYDLWMVLDGVGKFTVNDTSHDISAGSAFLLLPGCSGIATHEPATPLTVVAVHFDYFGPTVTENDYLYLEVEQVDFVGELLRQAIVAGVNQQQDDADFWLSAALRKTLPVSKNGIQNRYASEIELLCLRIIHHPEKSYKVADMAMELCVCKDHFTRVFKSLKGVSPQDYVVRSRVECARTLLLNSNLTVSEIADQLGYSSVNFFSRQFKEQTGKSPLQYRRGK